MTKRNTKKALLKFSLSLVVLIGIALAIKAYVLYQAISPSPLSFWAQSAAKQTRTVDHQLWGNFLAKYVISIEPNGATEFNYQRVTNTDTDTDTDRQSLNTYLAQIQRIDPRSLTKDQQLAYWINLYNALTIDLILRNIPISSIKEIGDGLTGPWNIEIANVAGKPLTLNNIEHGILRGLWKDPRIHYAINCASIGCPDLSPLPFIGHDISQQLDAAAIKFINQPKGVTFVDDTLTLSSIYNWFSVDFGENEQQLLTHLHHYAKPQLKKQLKNYAGDIEYEYNWKLNAPK